MSNESLESAPSISPLVALRERVDAWRKERPNPRSRMPEPLWEEIIVLARAHGLHATARALKVDYYSLKERMGAAPTNKGSRPAFVEVAVNPAAATIGE